VPSGFAPTVRRAGPFAQAAPVGGVWARNGHWRRGRTAEATSGARHLPAVRLPAAEPSEADSDPFPDLRETRPWRREARAGGAKDREVLRGNARPGHARAPGRRRTPTANGSAEAYCFPARGQYAPTRLERRQQR